MTKEVIESLHGARPPVARVKRTMQRFLALLVIVLLSVALSTQRGQQGALPEILSYMMPF